MRERGIVTTDLGVETKKQILSVSEKTERTPSYIVKMCVQFSLNKGLFSEDKGLFSEEIKLLKEINGKV